MGAIISTAWSRAFLYLHALPLARFLFRHHGSKKSHNWVKWFLKPHLYFHSQISPLLGQFSCPLSMGRLKKQEQEGHKRVHSQFAFRCHWLHFLSYIMAAKRSTMGWNAFEKKPYLWLYEILVNYFYNISRVVQGRVLEFALYVMIGRPNKQNSLWECILTWQFWSAAH